MEWGGSILRPEATGFGALYFVKQMLETRNETLQGKTIAISGFGNVAWGAALKATQLGGKVITISGPDGYIYDPAGLDEEKINYMLELRASGNDVCEPYAQKFAGSKFFKGEKPWNQKADIYLTCATQNELNGDAHVLFAPGKAVNAGGVATSGLEMTQNSIRLHWSKEEVDEKLHYIMHSIHEQCVTYGKEPNGYINYVKGANVAGFMKVANAMLAQGVC